MAAADVFVTVSGAIVTLCDVTIVAGSSFSGGADPGDTPPVSASILLSVVALVLNGGVVYHTASTLS